jgi:hypothetical protein
MTKFTIYEQRVIIRAWAVSRLHQSVTYFELFDKPILFKIVPNIKFLVYGYFYIKF